MPRHNRNTQSGTRTTPCGPCYIRGHHCTNLAAFYREVDNALGLPENRVGNIDSFSEILTWPCDGGREKPYTLVWLDAEIARQYLDHQHMAQWLEGILLTCHPTNVSSITTRLMEARCQHGPTLFDFLVEVISQRAEYVRLILA